MISRNAIRQQAVAPRRPSVVPPPPRTARPAPPPQPAALLRSRRAAGLSLVELLVSLAITALLLTATMVAIDASFKAYAAAAESASAQSSTRMVVNRLMTLVRTSTAHGPLEPEADPDWPVEVEGDAVDTLRSDFLELMDPMGRIVRVEHRDEVDELWLLIDENPGAAVTGWDSQTPLLGGVAAAKFYVHRRWHADGFWVLDRGTMDVSVSPDVDNTLAIESDRREPIRAIASTMPRKLD